MLIRELIMELGIPTDLTLGIPGGCVEHHCYALLPKPN